jgi:hypothetical protein
MRTHTWMALAFAATTIAAPITAQDWHWSGRVGPNQWLEIKGVNGNIRAVASSGSQVEVEVTKTADRSDPDDVRMEVIQHSGGVTICAVYPAPRNREPNQCEAGDRWRSNTQDNDVKVNFTVRVPRGVQFDGRTVNGSVNATGLTGDAKAHTVNGSVNLTTTGLAEAATVNGSITVAMGRADWDDVLEFETVNGGITLELPGDVHTEVVASTVNGSISTDYPLTVRGRFGPKRLSGTIGRGGRELSLGTVNGDIEIRRRE